MRGAEQVVLAAAAAALVVADEGRAFSCARSWGGTYPSHSDTTF